MKKLSICCVAASAILLASCATSKVESTAMAVNADLAGSWETVEFVKDGENITGSKATISFQDPTFSISGNAGVNNYFGEVEVSDSGFKAGDNIGTTMMMGPEAEMAFEAAYLEAFKAVTSISMDGKSLVLSGDNVKIVYKKNSDGVWETTEVVVNGAAVKGDKATLLIDAKYAVDGNAGVNDYFGEVTVNGNKFSTNGKFGSTKMMGLPEAQAFENAFMTVLPALDKIELDGDTLTVSDETSKIVFKKATSAAPIEASTPVEE